MWTRPALRCSFVRLSYSVFKVKRTWVHHPCTSPAWGNQGGSPINARMKSLLSSNREERSPKLDPPPKSSPKKKPASKAKGSAKSERADDEDTVSVKKARKSASTSKEKGKKAKKQGEDDNALGEAKKEVVSDEPDESAKKEPELLLANKWDLEKGSDPTGWWISEKLDGVRTYFDGKKMISRLGNPFTPPQWFLDKLPKDVTLDGELFGGRGQFQSTVSIVKTINSPHWKEITFQIFDIPSRGNEPFEDRIEFLKKTFGPGGSYASNQIEVVEHTLATGRQHVLDKLKEIEGLGGEGLMLRKPRSKYEGKRSSSLLKIKTFYDAEAVIIDYAPGKGRNEGNTGALVCKMESGKTFKIGSGLNDQLRDKPPKIGAIITYRFQELTNDGIPRFASYIGEAIDKDKPKDAELPEHRRANAKPVDESE